jgi:hypothetical protein
MPSEYATSEPAPEPRPGPHPHAVRKIWLAYRSGPVDEVGDDQEVAGVAHLRDGADLECKPFAVARLVGFLQPQLFHPLDEAGLGFPLQQLIDGNAVGRRKRRQPALAELDRQVAAPRDLDRVLQRVRDVGEPLRHLVLPLEVLLGREALRPPLVAEHVAGGDADARFVRLEVARIQELHRVRGHHRQVQP